MYQSRKRARPVLLKALAAAESAAILKRDENRMYGVRGLASLSPKVIMRC